MRRDSIANTFLVATLLCIVCSVLVSAAAVGLRPEQEKNQVRERRKNILMAAGLYDPEASLDQLFEKVETKLVDLETGEFVEEGELDPQTYDPRSAAKNPQMSVEIPQDKDLGNIKRREKYQFVYLIRKDGALDQIVLPIRGKGLWSTLYGFLSLDKDLHTVRGITFYEHGETPGLGGEVDNPRWKAQWDGKTAIDPQGDIIIRVVQGGAPADSEAAQHTIDGMAGATITSQKISAISGI